MPVKVRRVVVSNNPADTVSAPEFVEVPFENRVTEKDGISFHWSHNQQRSFADEGVGVAHAAIAGDPIVEDKTTFGDSKS